MMESRKKNDARNPAQQGQRIRRQAMEDKEFADWIIEKRMDILSERKNLPDQEEVIAEIGEILGIPVEPESTYKIGETLDRIRWGEQEIYLHGFRDGIRLMKYLYSV